jgi:hypothetical protein
MAKDRLRVMLKHSYGDQPDAAVIRSGGIATAD